MNFLNFKKLTLFLCLLTILVIQSSYASTPPLIPVAVIKTGSIHGDTGTAYNTTVADKMTVIKIGTDNSSSSENLPADTNIPSKPVFAKNFTDLDAINTTSGTNNILFTSDDANCYGYKMFKGLHFSYASSNINIMVADFCFPDFADSISNSGYCDNTTQCRTMDGRCVSCDSTHCGSDKIKPGAGDTPGFIFRSPYDGNFCIKFDDLNTFYKYKVFNDQNTFNSRMLKTKFIPAPADSGVTLGDTSYVLKPVYKGDVLKPFDETITIVPSEYAANYYDYNLLIAADSALPTFKVNLLSFPVGDNTPKKLKVFPFDSHETTYKNVVTFEACPASGNAFGLTCASNINANVATPDPFLKLELPTDYLKNTSLESHKFLYIHKNDCVKSMFKSGTVCLMRFNNKNLSSAEDNKIVFAEGKDKATLVGESVDTTKYDVSYKNGWISKEECFEILEGGNRLHVDANNACVPCTETNKKVVFNLEERTYKCEDLISNTHFSFDRKPFFKHTIKVQNKPENCITRRDKYGYNRATGTTTLGTCLSLEELEGVESTITDTSGYKNVISDAGEPQLTTSTDATGKIPFKMPKGNDFIMLNNIDHCNRYARMARKSDDLECLSAETDTANNVHGVYRDNTGIYKILDAVVADNEKKKIVNHPLFVGIDVYVDTCPNDFYFDNSTDPDECKALSVCKAASGLIVYRYQDDNKCLPSSTSSTDLLKIHKVAGAENLHIDANEDLTNIAHVKGLNDKMSYKEIAATTDGDPNSLAVQKCEDYDATWLHTATTPKKCLAPDECANTHCMEEIGMDRVCKDLGGSTDFIANNTGSHPANLCISTKDREDIVIDNVNTDKSLIIKPSTLGVDTNSVKFINHKQEYVQFPFTNIGNEAEEPCEAGLLLHVSCTAAGTCAYKCETTKCDISAADTILYGSKFCVKNAGDPNNKDNFIDELISTYAWYDLDSMKIPNLKTQTSLPKKIRKANCDNIQNLEGNKIDLTSGDPAHKDDNYAIWAKITNAGDNFCIKYEDCVAFGGDINFSTSTEGALVWKATGYECGAISDYTPATPKTSTLIRFEEATTSATVKVGSLYEIESFIARTDCGQVIESNFYGMVVRELGSENVPVCEQIQPTTHFYDEELNNPDGGTEAANDQELIFRDENFKLRHRLFERPGSSNPAYTNDDTTQVIALKKILGYKAADFNSATLYFKESNMTYAKSDEYTRVGKEFVKDRRILLPADCAKQSGEVIFTHENDTLSNECKNLTDFAAQNDDTKSFVDAETSTIVTEANCVASNKLVLKRGTLRIGCITFKGCSNLTNYKIDLVGNECIDDANCPDRSVGGANVPTYLLEINSLGFCVTREQCINNRLGDKTNQYLTFIKPGATTVRKCIPWESCKTEPDSSSNADTSYIDYDNLACTNSAPGNADLKVNLEITAGNSYGFWMEICPVIVFEKEGGQVVDSGVFDQCKRDSADAVIDDTECPSTKYLSSYTNECLDACTPVFANDRTQNLMFKVEQTTTPSIRKLCVTAAECTMLQPNFAVELNFDAPASSECKAYDPVANTDKVISSDGIIGTEAECLAGKLFVADFLNPNFSYLIKWDNPERMNECRKRKDDLTFDCPAGTWKVLNSVFTTIPKAEEGCYDEPASRRLEGKLDLADALTLNNAGNAFTATCSNDQVKTKSIVGVGADTEPQAKVNRCVTRANFKDDASVELGLDMWYKTATITGTTYASESVAIDSCETGLGADPNFPLRNKTHECLTQAQCNQFTDYMFLNNSDAAKKECLPKQTFCNGTLIKAFLGAGTGKAECVPIDQCSNNGIDSSNYYVDFGETEISCKHKTSNQCIYEHYDNSVVTTATCFSYKTCSANNYYYRIEGTKSSCISRDTCLDGNDTKPLLEQKLLGKDFNTYNRCYTYDECYNTAEMFINPDTKECLTRTACENLCAGKTNCDFVVEDHFCYSQLDTETFFTEPVLAFTKGLKVYSEFCDFSLKIFEKKCVESCELFTNSAGTECYSKCEFCALTDGFERPRLCMDVSSVPADFNLIDYGNYNNRNNDCKVLTQSTNLDGMKLMNGEFYPCPDNKVVREGTTGFKCVNTCPDYTIDKGDFCESCNDNYRGKAEPEKDKFFGSSCVQTVPSSAVRVDISRNGYADCSELTDYALEGGICKQRCTQTGFGKKDGLCLNVNDITDSCIDEKTGNIITSSQCVSQGDTKCISGYCRIPAQCASNQLTRNNECLPCDSDSSFVLYNGQCISECPATNGTEPLIRSNGNCRTCNQVEPALVYNAESQACEISLSQNLCTGTWDSANNACDCIDVKTGPYCDTASLDGNTRAAQLVKEATEIVSNLSGLGIVTGSFTSKQRGSLITSINLSAYFAVNDSSSAYSVYSSNMTDLESSVAAKCEEAKQQYETSIDKNNATQEAVGKQGMDDICNLTNDIQKAKDILTNRDNKRTNVVNRNGNNGTASRNTSSRRLQQVENSPRVLQQASNEIIRNTVRSYLEVYSLLPERLEAASKFTRDTYLFYTHPVTQDEAKNEEYRTFMRSNKGNYLDLKTCSDSVFAAATGTPVAAFIEWINPLKASTASNEIEWHLFDSGTRGKLDLSSLCPGVETSFEVSTTLVADIDQELLSKYWRAAVSNIYDPRTRFFNDKCFQFSEDDLDYTVQMRRGLFPGKELLCGTDCRLGPLSDENSLECICVNRSASQLTLQDYTFSEYSKTDYIGSTLTCINEISSFEHINDSYVFWYFFIVGVILAIYWSFLFFVGSIEGLVAKHHSKLKDNNCLTKVEGREADKFVANYGMVGNINSAEGSDNNRKDENAAESERRVNSREQIEGNSDEHNESVGGIKIQTDVQLTKIDLDFIPIQKSVDSDMRGFVEYCWDKIRCNNLLISPLFSYSLVRPYHYRILELLVYMTVVGLFNYILWYDDYVHAISDNSGETVTAKIFAQFRHGWDIILYSILLAHVIKVFLANLLTPTQAKIAELTEPLAKEEKESIIAQYKKLFKRQLVLFGVFCAVGACLIGFTIYLCWVYASFYGNSGLNWLIRTILSAVIGLLVLQPLLAVLSFVAKELSRKVSFFRFFYYLARM